MANDSIEVEIDKIYDISNTTRRYFLINEDDSLTRLAANKVEKKKINLDLSGGRKDFDIIEGCFLSFNGNLFMLISVNVHSISLVGDENKGLALSPYYNPSSFQLKQFLKASFFDHLFFYLDEHIAFRENLLRKVKLSELDKYLSDNKDHEKARGLYNRIDDKVPDKSKYDLMKNIYELHNREIKAGIEVDKVFHNKLREALN